VNDEFSFRSTPQFIFHDSPGFEAGGEKELQDVLCFLQEKANAKEVQDQIHAIWCVWILACSGSTNNASRFCFAPNVSRPLLELEESFFNEQLGSNGEIILESIHRG
jgi:hypothetical protein